MRKRLYNGDFSFLPMLLDLNVKNQSKLPKSLLVGGQCLDRVMFCSKPSDFDDFSLTLTKYLMFPNSYFCEKNLKSTSLQNSSLAYATPACHVLCVTVVNQIVDQNPLRKK